MNSDPERLPEIDETTAAILRFEGERIASFVTSFNAADAGWYEVLWDEGSHQSGAGVRVCRGPGV